MNTILIGSKSFDNKYVAEIISHLHTKILALNWLVVVRKLKPL